MKLRALFSPVQHLFTRRPIPVGPAGGRVGMAVAAVAAAAVVPAMAQDRVVFTDGRAQDGKIVAVAGGNLQMRVGQGDIALPLARVKEVAMAVPGQVADAQKAYEAGDFPSALAAAKAVADRFKGLPTEWAKDALLTVADCYSAINENDKAEAAFKEFEKLYPGQGTAVADVGVAKIAVAQKDYAKAKEKLQPIADQAMKTARPNPAQGRLYGRAFLLLGQIAAAEGDPATALVDYLRTATIFYQDATAAAEAKKLADALRQQQQTVHAP